MVALISLRIHRFQRVDFLSPYVDKRGPMLRKVTNAHSFSSAYMWGPLGNEWVEGK